MTRKFLIRQSTIALLAFGLAAAAGHGQEQRKMELNAPPPAAGRAPAAAPRGEAEPKKMTPEQMKRGRAWLETAEAQAKGLEGGMRAYALLQVARALPTEQKAHALELLEDALTASKAMPDDEDAGQEMRRRLQQQILQAMVPLAPERADELLTQLDPEGRENVLQALLAHYRKTKQDKRAMEMIYRISAEKEFPYGAGMAFMRELPPAKQGELQQMFTMALGSYREHSKSNGLGVGSDFSDLIVEFQPKLSPDLVKEAIAEVLRRAEATDKEEGADSQVRMASAQGSAAFAGWYEYRLFQLLPALRAVDPDEADRLLKKNREVAGMLEKYPRGLGSLLPAAGDRRPGGGASFMVGRGPDRPGSGSAFNEGEMARAQKIMADAEAHPQDALANVSTLTSAESKVRVLEGIARVAWKKNPSVARSALKQMMEALPQLRSWEQIMPVRAAATLYVEIGDTAEARKAIEKGFESAAKLYQQDSDADDPNKALEAYWPSANAYTGLLRVAAEIAPDWAMEQLKEVPDDAIKTLAQIAMASALLGKPQGMITIANQKKDGTNMMMMMRD